MKKLLLFFGLLLGVVFTSAAQAPNKDLFKAVMKNDAAAVETLLKGGADANAAIEVMPGFKTTYLITAVTNGNLDIVKKLVQYKAQVNAKDAGQETALMAAAAKGDKAMVEFLLASGADPKATDSQGNTALNAAKTGGNKDVISLIEQKSK
ncbi:ankyrin repeat domain-containing protein [Hymenobacter oligotrophus]|uniref:Ankyrin repeat domain-containing protein n=1 Tax=Hymenobacter oligotrophus TaxID=2319843 RepID=A0A3B7QYI3_9BACT|nr:ankyrin repeat domain-containing protein [Hymenobacter oligotrophus]AYA36150.1 ankyrin repeat domain-containing protein [Hymenobacter oligotrophus]